MFLNAINMRHISELYIYSITFKAVLGTALFHFILLQRLRYDYMLAWGNGSI